VALHRGSFKHSDLEIDFAEFVSALSISLRYWEIEEDESWNNTADRRGAAFAGRHSHLAAQQELGLPPDRRHRGHIDHLADSGLDGANLIQARWSRGYLVAS
jgi:hypothetical protein